MAIRTPVEKIMSINIDGPAGNPVMLFAEIAPLYERRYGRHTASMFGEQLFSGEFDYEEILLAIEVELGDTLVFESVESHYLNLFDDLDRLADVADRLEAMSRRKEVA
ncbi:hypothetical protein [uncultured Umboniibacter sp.]|uniref:hypothetical protein n=1 Tax=uncultured Umboniibacter sp. TaxID=1798917 RepID=UPI002636CA40|nr:hypothetical protein [uncultured Umboniibacter sp.]